MKGAPTKALSNLVLSSRRLTIVRSICNALHVLGQLTDAMRKRITPLKGHPTGLIFGFHNITILYQPAGSANF
jgi:hypothetical protein